MANNQFPTSAIVQFDGASPQISEASQIARGFHRDAAVLNAPVHQSAAQHPANFGCQSSIGVRALGNYSTYNAPAVPSYPRQSTPSASHNAVKQSALTTSIQEHVPEDRNTTSEDMNASESVAGIMQGLTGLTLDPSKRELVQPQESSSLAAQFADADSDSGCMQSSDSFPVATAPECAEDRSGSVGDDGYASASAGSAGVLAAAMPDAKVEPRIVLDMQKLEAIFCKRTITRSAVAQHAASIDLFYSVDEDKDTQLHICLYDFRQYSNEAWNLVAGSRPDWLSIKNNRGLTPLMCAVMYDAEVDMVRALSLLSFSLTLPDLRGYTALHYAAHLGRLELVDAMLLEPTPHECLLVNVFFRDELFAERQPELSYQSLLARHRAAVATLLASRNAAGETPLFCAVKSSNFDVTARLLAMRADPRIEELSEGKTALILAVQLLQTKIVHALLSYPSPQMVEELVNKRTRAGVSPLRAARRMICCDPQQRAELAEIIARLVGAGGLESVESADENDSEHDESMRSSQSSPDPVSDVEGEERAESQHAN